MNYARAALLIIAMLIAAPILIHGQPADNIYWSDDFAETNGMNGAVLDMVVYDDLLIVAGKFTTAGGKDIRLIAAWDGYRWSSLGNDDLEGDAIYDLHVFGGNLYAGGYFSIGPPDPIFGRQNLAVWNGSSWDWVDGRANDTVFSVTDVNGYLTVGGAFTNMGGSAAEKTAYYDGANWHRFSNNIAGTVRDIVEYNGSIYAAGDFKNLSISGGSVYVGSLVHWSGTEWVGLSSYLSMPGTAYPVIYDLLVFDGKLVATGYFYNAVGSGVGLQNIGAWDGSSWSAIGDGVNYARSLFNYNGDLVVGETDGVSRWTGSAWEEMVDSESGEILSFAYYKYIFYIGGGFRKLDDDSVNYVAQWAGMNSARPVRTGFNGAVNDIKVWDSKLAVCGEFTRSGEGEGYKIASWDFSQWSPLTEFTDQVFINSHPQALLVREDTLFAVGAYGTTASSVVRPLMRFNGTGWDDYGPPMGTYPSALSYPTLTALTFNDEIVLGGINPTPLPFLFVLKPTTVEYYGGPAGAPVYALMERNGALVAGGAFTSMVGTPSRGISSWNGSEWSGFGTGIHGTVSALAAYGDLIIAGGEFDSAGSVAANNIAAWNGTNWQALGDGVDARVSAIAVHDNSLIVGGDFVTAGGISADYIAQWYGSSWSPLGTGLDGPVRVLLAHDTSVYVGGEFTTAGDKSSPYFARWDKYQGLPTSVDDNWDNSTLPGDYNVSHNYPNPFNPATTIEFSLAERSYVTIEVFNLLGQKVKSLIEREESAGSYTVTWNGTDEAGESVSTGVYLYRFKAGDHVETKKMLLLK
ncbi:MAG: T9SS type A sorting domain-containing protein [candidate division Zixibacteria bacterium]|nr:T9SS type A sorting domain-containing protein [candidate division Zixibacteria bacterium]